MLCGVQEITFGQFFIVFEWPFLPGGRVVAPAEWFNWTMTLQPDGSWARYSTSFGVPSEVGIYTLRQAVDGEGNPGPYWEGWLKDQGGDDFLYGVTV